jgi:hypothetical protein
MGTFCTPFLSGPGDAAPPEPIEPTEGQSLQELCSMTVMVDYSATGNTAEDIEIESVTLTGGVVLEPECLAPRTLAEWRESIATAIRDRDEADAREEWEASRDYA